MFSNRLCQFLKTQLIWLSAANNSRNFTYTVARIESVYPQSTGAKFKRVCPQGATHGWCVFVIELVGIPPEDQKNGPRTRVELANSSRQQLTDTQNVQSLWSRTERRLQTAMAYTGRCLRAVPHVGISGWPSKHKQQLTKSIRRRVSVNFRATSDHDRGYSNGPLRLSSTEMKTGDAHCQHGADQTVGYLYQRDELKVITWACEIQFKRAKSG